MNTQQMSAVAELELTAERRFEVIDLDDAFFERVSERISLSFAQFNAVRTQASETYSVEYFYLKTHFLFVYLRGSSIHSPVNPRDAKVRNRLYLQFSGTKLRHCVYYPVWM